MYPLKDNQHTLLAAQQRAGMQKNGDSISCCRRKRINPEGEIRPQLI